MAVCGNLLQSFPNFSKTHCNIQRSAPDYRRPTIDVRLSTLDYPSYIFSVSFVFLNSLLFCVISTVQWSSAISICDGIIARLCVAGIMCFWLFSKPVVLIFWEIHLHRSESVSINQNARAALDLSAGNEWARGTQQRRADRVSPARNGRSPVAIILPPKKYWFCPPWQ